MTNRFGGCRSCWTSALHELEDWTCCGSTSAHCTDEALAVALPVRNLRIAETTRPRDDRPLRGLLQPVQGGRGGGEGASGVPGDPLRREGGGALRPGLLLRAHPVGGGEGEGGQAAHRVEGGMLLRLPRRPSSRADGRRAVRKPGAHGPSDGAFGGRGGRLVLQDRLLRGVADDDADRHRCRA